MSPACGAGFGSGQGRMSVMSIRLVLLLSFLVVSFASAEPVFAADGSVRLANAMPSVVRIGLQKNLGPDFLIESFAPTMRLLRSSHPGTRFQTSFYSADELTEAVRNRKIDAFFADSALFGVLQLEAGAMQIAARAAPYVRDPSQAASFAVIVRRGSHIRTLADVPGERIAAEDKGSFSTWLLFQGLLKNNGVLKEGWDAKVRFTGYSPPDPILLVQQAAADVAVVPACRLESLIDADVVREHELTVLNEQPLDGFPCRRSADLFPDIVLAVPAGTDAELASSLSVTVMSAPLFGMGERWRIASDFSKAADIYKLLGIGPYREPEEPTFRAFWSRYRNGIIAVFAALALLALHSFLANRLVEKRTRALRAAVEEKDRAAKAAREAQDHLAQLERSSVVSGLSSMFAHEVRQPLAAVVAYAGGIRLAAKRVLTSPDAETERRIADAAETLAGEAQRVSDIVERVRSYAKSGGRKHERIDVARLVERAKTLFEHGSASVGTTVDLRVPEGLAVRGEPLELELALVNLLRNAAAAMTDRPAGERLIVIGASLSHSAEPSADAGDSRQETTKSSPSFVVLTVEDEGAAAGPIADEVFARLSEPVRSGKKEGLGLGLFIVRRIAEAHGGSLLFQRRDPPSNGLCALLRLPADGNAPRDNETATLQPTESTSKS